MRLKYLSVLISVIFSSGALAQSAQPMETLDSRAALSILLGDSIQTIESQAAASGSSVQPFNQEQSSSARAPQAAVDRQILLPQPVSRVNRGSGSGTGMQGQARDTARADIAPFAGISANYPDRVIVQRGDTLDTVIQRSMPGSPFNQGFLRAAFVRFNPETFAKGNLHRLSVGTSLRVPSQLELVSLVVGSKSAASVLPHAGARTQPTEARESEPLMAQQQLNQDRKNWVRYP